MNKKRVALIVFLFPVVVVLVLLGVNMLIVGDKAQKKRSKGETLE